MNLNDLAPQILTIAAPIAGVIAWAAVRADRASDERISRLKAWSEGLEYANKKGDRLLKELAYQIGLNARKVSLLEIEGIAAAYPDEAQRVIRIYDSQTANLRWTSAGFFPRGRHSLGFRCARNLIGYLGSAGLSLRLAQGMGSNQPGSGTEGISLLVLTGLAMLLAATFLFTAIHIWDGRKLLAMKPSSRVDEAQPPVGTAIG